MSRSQSLKVLIVDDNRSAADAMARMLRKQGDEVRAVYDGVAAIEAMTAEPPDLVLTDMKMEPVDGLEVLRVAREQRPPVEVIVFTAYGAVDLAVRAMRMGARDFLTKPVTIDQISQRLSQLRGSAVAPIDDAFDEFVAEDPSSRELVASLRRIADVPSPVWIEGEIGSGRGFTARTLHRLGGDEGPFTVYDVARDGPWPESGTVLLPSVDDLPDDLQRELARRIPRAPAGVRLVATAAVDARHRLAEGTLRPDLYYALAVVVVAVPALRNRPADILPLLDHGLSAYAARYGRERPLLPPGRRHALQAHAWPGNVRELLNLAERAVVLGPGAFDMETVEASAPGLPKLEPGFSLSTYLENVERRLLVEALRKADGDRTQAGQLLGVERNTLRYKLKKYDLLEK